MAEIKFEKEWLDAALNQCAAELSDMLKSEHALVKSATDDAPAEESEGSEGPSSPPPSDESAGGEASPAVEASAPPAGGEASAPDDGMPPAAPEASASPEASAPGQEQAIEPAPTVEQLQAEYMKLDPEALKMHYLAAKSALAAAMGAGAPPEASAPGAGAPPPGAAPAGPPPGAAPMAMSAKKPNLAVDKKPLKPVGKGPSAEENEEWDRMKSDALTPAKKGEMKLTDGNGGEIEAGKMAKSEAKIAELEATIAKQGESLLALAEVIATPIRKSIKGLSDLRFIERTEEAKASPAASLTKKEVQAALSEKVRGGKLSKKDKELVMQYSVGSVDITKIEHLLADAK